MTPALKRILYSGDKHSIVQGPYGSGKSILTCKKLHMLSNELQESKKTKEQIHFICFDSYSALLIEVKRSPIVMTHLIVDELDCENLDKQQR